MNKLHKIAAGLATALLAASAHAIVIDRVVLPDGNVAFSATVGMAHQTIAPDGSVSGYGIISVINGRDENTFCPGCQLTYQYTGVQPLPGDPTQFAGGMVNFYVGDRTVPIDLIGDYMQFSAANTLTNNLFLTLQLNRPFTPVSDGNGLFSSLLYLDVAKSAPFGAANSYFDTNGSFMGADLALNISSHAVADAGPGLSSVGTGNVTGALARPVPEPASLALVGLGMMGLLASRKRKVQPA